MKMLERAQMTRESAMFFEALEQPSTEVRAAFVERATAGDPKLKEAVEALLANDQPESFLDQALPSCSGSSIAGVAGIRREMSTKLMRDRSSPSPMWSTASPSIHRRGFSNLGN
jgi:hypothetical protein